jgi:predicted glutamine amidotransferase
VLAHVRRATVGGASTKNTHPFVHGCWAFAHNGTIENFKQIQVKLENQTSEEISSARLGATDSETLFYWFLTRFQQSGIPLDAPSNQKNKLVQTIAKAIHDLGSLGETKSLADRSQLNLIFTNGRTLLATRWNHSLYYVYRLGVHDCEICGVPHIRQESADDYRACVVASEPISSEKWIEVPNRSILVICDAIKPSLHRIS